MDERSEPAEEAPAAGHLLPDVLDQFLKSLPVFEAGVVLHLLECGQCAARALAELAPRGPSPPAPLPEGEG
ncbi:MAG TPA: hypothetical protein VF756_05305 [Thermoanaerobaculia bacterium]